MDQIATLAALTPADRARVIAQAQADARNGLDGLAGFSLKSITKVLQKAAPVLQYIPVYGQAAALAINTLLPVKPGAAPAASQITAANAGGAGGAASKDNTLLYVGGAALAFLLLSKK